ncbi:MAG: thermosome subunit beta [Nanoarchaeota archaeon]|nr:TCP-1/cpn60 chaperonin family protein [Nanoarchaeota archaeon]MBU4300228.1 TCP-1/cpn60 chaperonin family protein [Nanoarchaeota archaeon]MBU4451614.1 TCP-1/cpn60 chaperonin family protein [Nanoarchaeota archaeon]MCG2723136.1 TCP-1/cpn60 chaperonin family protein [archaeon]
MANQQGQGQPIFILPEGAFKDNRRSAQRQNIAAARAVADAVRSTLGPKGMDKMLTDSIGDVVITNDGVTILEEMEIEHPAAKMVVEVAKTQNKEVGDGTTTAVIIAGALLKESEALLDQNVHPTIIASGYRLAKTKALEILKKIAIPITLNDKDLLKNIAITSMTGKSAESAGEHLAKIAVDGVISIAEKDGNKITINLDNLKMEKKAGGSTDETELIKGIIVDKERVHSGMASSIKDAKIALVDAALEIKETETDAQIRITDPSQLQAFVESEEKMLKTMVEKIVASGANVLFCQKGIDDMAQHFLSKKGIFAARRVKKSDMDALARATGARVVTSLNDLEKTDIGFAGLVEEIKVGGEAMTFVRECKEPKAVSIIVRGGTEHVVEEIYRAMDDAVKCVAAALEVGFMVAGGGAPEAEVAKDLRRYADQVGGREQLAVNAFANAMEIIPRTLAENAGLDPIDILVELRARHDKGMVTAGVDVMKNTISDMKAINVIEPLKIKTQAIKSASEAAEMILRIDDIISASKLSKGGMPPGMGSMGGDY